MTEDFLIRPARSADLPGLVIIEQSSFAAPTHRPWKSSELSEELADGRLFLVAERGRDGAGAAEDIAAYLIYRLIGDEAELLRMAVAPTSRRRGLARQLMSHAFVALRTAGVTQSHLEVRADNRAAITLYEDMGYQRVGRRPGYYPDGAEALLLRIEWPENGPSALGLESLAP